jgi:N-acyl-D-amino-acid deacylase
MGIPLEEIVYRMSVLPCRFLGIDDPVLAPGADASLVLFDPESVRERNDYLDPEVPPEGIDAVWVHGDLVLDQGRIVPPARYPGRIVLPTSGVG